jgi:hypothetical protein
LNINYKNKIDSFKFEQKIIIIILMLWI